MAVGRINGVAALTGFIIRKCIGVSPGQKEVTIIMRWL